MMDKWRLDLAELNRKAAMYQAAYENEIKTRGSLPCPYCSRHMTRVPSHSRKWMCTCSPGLRFHDSGNHFS